MKVIYSDGQLWRVGGQLHLAHLAEGWCVVGPSYLRSVEGVQDGYRVMAGLRDAGKRCGVAIDYDEGGEESLLFN